MNLEVTDVTRAPPARNAVQDWAVLVLIGAGFVASWVYVFMHPSPGAFMTCIGGTGTWSIAFHWIVMRDDKEPDRKSDT